MEGFVIGRGENDEEPEIRVVDLSTGQEVFAPGIAAKALGSIASAVDAAGGKIEVPDDISSLFPTESGDQQE